MFLPNLDEKIIGTKSLSKLKNDQKKLLVRDEFLSVQKIRGNSFSRGLFSLQFPRVFGAEAQVCWRTKKSPKTKIEPQES